LIQTRKIFSVIAFVGSFLLLVPEAVLGQGETTSAIVGTVSDQTGAAIPNATVTIIQIETQMKRSATTDDSGRFNFAQLKPGSYSVKAEADGFESQQNPAVSSGLGQKQTVDFTLKIAESRQTL